MLLIAKVSTRVASIVDPTRFLAVRIDGRRGVSVGPDDGTGSRTDLYQIRHWVGQHNALARNDLEVSHAIWGNVVERQDAIVGHKNLQREKKTY